MYNPHAVLAEMVELLLNGLNSCSEQSCPAQLSGSGFPKLTNSGSKLKTWLLDGPFRPSVLILKRGRGDRNRLWCEPPLH